MTSLRPWPLRCPGGLDLPVNSSSLTRTLLFTVSQACCHACWCAASYIVKHGNATLGLQQPKQVCAPMGIWTAARKPAHPELKVRALGWQSSLFFSGISRINLGLPTLRSYNHSSTDLFQPVSRIHLNPSPTERAHKPWKVLFTWLPCWCYHEMLLNYY